MNGKINTLLNKIDDKNTKIEINKNAINGNNNEIKTRRKLNSDLYIKNVELEKYIEGHEKEIMKLLRGE